MLLLYPSDAADPLHALCGSVQMTAAARYGILVYFASAMLTTAMDALESAQFGTAACLGGCFMPLLGAAPDAMLIVATTTSQASVAFGVKILANSNVVLLTIPWVIALFMGRRPLTLLQVCTCTTATTCLAAVVGGMPNALFNLARFTPMLWLAPFLVTAL